MIVEERIYTLHPQMVPEWLAIYADGANDMQTRYLGQPIGYYTSEFGPLNQIVHMWAYRDMEDRLDRRTRLNADPGWKVHRERLRPLIMKQENKLLMPTKFSPKLG